MPRLRRATSELDRVRPGIDERGVNRADSAASRNEFHPDAVCQGCAH
jgi:hypothetical protein